MMKAFAVFGNPIAHSKSPRIHALFSEQCKCPLTYEKRRVEFADFESDLADFFAQGGSGANITTPFKERAHDFCHDLTERAKLAGAVNTIKKLEDGQLLGDNTDGIGLLTDLQRLNMLQKGDRVLLIGAGGAARGAVLPLLEFGCKLVITNRTLSRAEQLSSLFSAYGDITSKALDELADEQFDLIINATSSGLSDDVPALPVETLSHHPLCYDMLYRDTLTPFLQWSKDHGVTLIADGLGMLVGQAAHAFYIWHGVMPEIESVLNVLRKDINQ